MTHASCDSTIVRDRAGFTLIEVLIGVIVLGLGLLGLASVFPAVVVQQKQAADAVQGDSTAKSVEAQLRASPSFNRPFDGAADRLRINTTFSIITTQAGRTAWEIGTGLGNENGAVDFNVGDGSLFVRMPEGGRVTVDLQNVVQGVQSIQNAEAIEITQVSRLFPQPKFRAEGAGTLRNKNDGPQFVWDMALRRDKGTSALAEPLGSDALQVAIFVRRVDPGIRGNLDTVFGGATPVVAVAAGANGAPTLNGRGAYSPIHRGQLSVYQPTNGDPVARNVVIFEPGSVERIDDAVVLEWLARAGQKFVGPQGQVWTVLAVRDVDGDTVMTLDQAMEDRTQDLGGDTVDILFTMHTPANVRVISLAAPDRPAYGPTN